MLHNQGLLAAPKPPGLAEAPKEVELPNSPGLAAGWDAPPKGPGLDV